MTKSVDKVPVGQIIASTMSADEYTALRNKAERILSKIPEHRQRQSRSRTMGELFDSMDESFKVISTRTKR